MAKIHAVYAYALTKADRKEGQKVIPKAYIEAVATWIAKKMEERHVEE